MKERPILFSGPMVRALIDGRKTQTRRVVKPQPFSVSIVPSGNHLFDYRSDLSDYSRVLPMSEAVKRCPYGQPGDRLWVRETFSGSMAYERHGYPLKDWGNKLWFWAHGNPPHGDWTRPKPSIHMPRVLSRILLEITEVRVQRLQDISEEDAAAEGLQQLPASKRWVVDAGEQHGGLATHTAVGRFRMLWEEINGAASWEENPWVWCVSFKVLQP